MDEYDQNEWFNGSIKSISMENFMCHSNFYLTFNPRINFISGLNGSGKSAIQTAIVVGFGARASITNRASALTSLIKYNCSSATISITIANGNEGIYGIGPFKPEIYGKQITIVRQITDTGTSPFKILNENGKIVKGSKSELNEIIIHFNILVENPICVMNQAMVKTFHKSANPKEKYDLFYKAISANIYNESIEHTKLVADESFEKLKNIESVMNQCFKEVHEYEKFEKKLKQLETLKNSKTQLENEYAWRIISQTEETYNDCLNQIELHKTNISQSTEKLSILEENIQTSSEELKIKKSEWESVEDARSRNHFIFMEIKTELKNKFDECDLAKQNARKQEHVLNSLINDRKDLERHIEVEKKKGNENNLAECKKKLIEYEENISGYEAAWKTNIQHEQNLRNTIDNFIQKIGNLKNNEITPLQKRIGELNRNMNSMSQQQDKISFYGNWMPQLVQAVDIAFKQNRFKKKPIGPIGAYIKVNDNKWIFSIENNLNKSLLRSFLVDNIADTNILQSIMDKIIPVNARKPSIITSKFFDKFHNITNNETKNSMFRMLTFTNPVVGNSLIDNNCIETIMLVEQLEDALPLMDKESRVPKNCQYILTLDGTRIYPSPSLRVYSLQNPFDPIYLQSNVTVAINNLKHQKKDLEIKINNLNVEFESLEQLKLEQQQQLNRTQAETKLLKSKYEEYLKQINKLRAKCEEEEDDRLAILTDEINEVNLKIDQNQKLKDDINKPILMYEKEIKEIKDKLDKIKLTIDKTDRSAITERIEILQAQISKHTQEISQINNDITNQKKSLNELIKKAEKIKKELENNLIEAERLCEKIVVTRNENDIKRDIEEINHKKHSLEMELNKSDINHQVFRDEYKKKKEEFIHYRTLYKQIVNIYNDNKKTIEFSIVNLEKYIESVKLKVVEAFDMVLKLRKIKGKLEIDQYEENMVITMFDNISTSCASGGERTFATVALILALWSNMQLPFYSIDEYDVYMDNVNRLATTEMLMSSIEQRKSQYIFLTPQDISHIKSAHNIKIVRLKEPRS